MMVQTFKVSEITIGYHPTGYRIDGTAFPMNLYTKWDITPDGRWVRPRAVCFDSLPQEGWCKADGFDWNEEVNATKET